MTNHEQEIERRLALAPRPAPPDDLKHKLVAQVRFNSGSTAHGSFVIGARGWLSRWWPVLVPSAVSAACAMMIAVQQLEIRDLKQVIATLSRTPAAAPVPASAGPAPNQGPAGGLDLRARQQEEWDRLSDKAAKLRAEVARLERMRQENADLRAQLFAPGISLTGEEVAAVEKAADKARSIQCVNNLKQLGLSVRVWALDNGGTNPPAILCMTNEMSTPKILVCPADSAHQAAADWGSWSSANCSYDYLAPGGSDTEPQRVLWRCPVHGHMGLCDGSVQSEIFKTHPESIVQRDGKLYYEPAPASEAPANSAQPAPKPKPFE